MNREEIMGILPHRDHMLLLDDAEELDGTAVGHYTVRGDEFFLKGHFPGKPVVPGVILCEIMAQGSAILFAEGLEGKIPLYASMDNVKFKRVVKPGDSVITRSTIVMHRGPVFVVEAKATVEGEMCCSGRLTFMLIDKEKEI
jgi:3-hydroxyacyl-[acyl-carrier-protein] dehydratase